MVLTKSDIAGRWAEDEILALWASYDPDNDEPIAFTIAPDGSQLCCDCASNRLAEAGIPWDAEDDPEGWVEAEGFDAHLGCDDCSTVIAFD